MSATLTFLSATPCALRYFFNSEGGGDTITRARATVLAEAVPGPLKSLLQATADWTDLFSNDPVGLGGSDSRIFANVTLVRLATAGDIGAGLGFYMDTDDFVFLSDPSDQDAPDGYIEITYDVCGGAGGCESNIVFEIPIPNSGGISALFDTSTMACEKLCIVSGDGDGQIVIEGTHDDVNLFPLRIFDPGNVGFTQPVPIRIEAIVKGMRIRRLRGSGPGTMTVSAVGNAVNTFALLPTPIGGGVGAAVPVGSSGNLKTVGVSGPFDGTISIEGASDLTHFGPFATFDAQNSDFRNIEGPLQRLRVKRIGGATGFPNPIPPVVTVGIATCCCC